jgi:nucleotide-binding universal stress UspA family protein
VRVATIGYLYLRQQDAAGDALGACPPDLVCEGGAALNENLGLPRIVVGVDGSSASLAALRWAVREARLRGTALHVVRAWEDAAKRVAPYASHAYPPGRAEDLLDASQRLEAEVTAAVGGTSLDTVTVEIAEGLAARVLLDHADGAEMLVLGSARCTPDGIGPVARACLRHAPGPVVVVSIAMSGVPVPA